MKLLLFGNRNSDVDKALEVCSKLGASVHLVEDLQGCLEQLRNYGADLLFVDVRNDIATVVESIRSNKININIIAYGFGVSTKEAVRAVKAGAKDFIALPPDPDLIGGILSSISKSRHTKTMVYESLAMHDVVAVADKVAKSGAHILVTGQSGTGKEVIAHYIHQHSARSNKQFVRVNCAAIPESLLESELFGYEKGAFTGAIAKRIGKFEESSGGTLLLDEISEMDVRLQAKLLRAIQESEIDRIGGSGPIKVNLRIIATSNQDMQSCIAKGTFREDLYFRLNVINLHIPSLSDRKEDIPPLSKMFVEKYAKINDMSVKPITARAMDALLSYSWPGNIRELENMIHRAVLLSGESIDLQDFDFKHKRLTDSEHEWLKQVLSTSIGDVNDLASILGISVSSLHRRLQEYTNTKSK